MVFDWGTDATVIYYVYFIVLTHDRARLVSVDRPTGRENEKLIDFFAELPIDGRYFLYLIKNKKKEEYSNFLIIHNKFMT